MRQDEAVLLLERAGIFRHPCDLDLLLFFVGHPRTLLSSEWLATFLGYELQRIAESLEVLLGAGLIKRRQTAAHAARLYVLDTDGRDHPWLPSILEMTSTRKGRILLKKAFALRGGEESEESSVTGARPKKTISNAVALRSGVRRIRRRGGR